MIEPISNRLQLLDNYSLKNDSKEGRISFAELLKSSVDNVNQLQKEADQIAEDFTLGKIDDIHKVTIATEKAQLALNLTLAIQNKVVDAYKEIMRIQI